MENAIFASIRKNMIYDTERAPLDNIDTFFKAVKTPQYEWISVKSEDNKKVRYFLDSAWRNEAGLQEITRLFYEAFMSNVVKQSMDEAVHEDYLEILKSCKKSLTQINHYYIPSFTRMTIIRRHARSRSKDGVMAYDDLPPMEQQVIANCHELIKALWIELEDFVVEEMRDHQLRESIRIKSDYRWGGDKNDLSELARALFETGRIKRAGDKTMKAGTFARDLAAFFGVEKLNFDQDIDLIYSRQNRQQGEFLSTCLKDLLYYFEHKH